MSFNSLASEKTMDKEIRMTVLKRDGLTCQACGKYPAAQVHHIKARGRGGKDELPNLITLCGRCHMIISPVPPFALWKAFRVPESEIPVETKRIEKAIQRFQDARVC